MTGDQRHTPPTDTLEQRLNVDFALQAAGMGIWEYDPVSNQVLWDERCRALFGVAANNRMSYEQAFEHVHRDDIARVDQAARWVMNPQSDGIFDETYRTVGVDDNKLRWVRFQGRVEFTATGEVQRFGGVAHEVTEQVRDRQQIEQNKQQIEAAQQNLLQTNQRLNLAMVAGHLGSYTLDLSTGLMDVSAQCRANYGQPAGTPFNFSDLLVSIVADDRERVQLAVTSALATRTVYTAEYRIVWPDGTLHWVKASGQPEYGSDGQPVRMTGVTQETTSQRLVQEELENQVQQRTGQLQASINDLRRSNENLQQFAYIASHDLQEPLRKIQSFSDLLRTRLLDSLTGDELSFLERIQGAANRMSILIKDLLTYSRISTEQRTGDTVALNQVINDVFDVLDLPIAASHAHIQVETLPAVPGDPVQLGQLFQNLISNALKFHQVGTVPHIYVRSQVVDTAELPLTGKPLRSATQYVRIDVADQGIGFDEKYLDRIFQVFQRLHGKTTYAGTGVGLAICEKVVANHGGAITASSQPGKGATFSVYLPA